LRAIAANVCLDAMIFGGTVDEIVRVVGVGRVFAGALVELAHAQRRIVVEMPRPRPKS
jgi:hypothetical protein